MALNHVYHGFLMCCRFVLSTLFSSPVLNELLYIYWYFILWLSQDSCVVYLTFRIPFFVWFLFNSFFLSFLLIHCCSISTKKKNHIHIVASCVCYDLIDSRIVNSIQTIMITQYYYILYLVSYIVDACAMFI